MKLKDRFFSLLIYAKNHKFGTLIFLAIVWLCFLSEHSLYAIWKLQREKDRLQTEIVNYRNNIEKFEQSINEVSGDKDAMEHFAREQLNMKKANEDVFLIEE
mgnify:CR=1 FL=1